MSGQRKQETRFKAMAFSRSEKAHIKAGLLRGRLSIRKVWNHIEREPQFIVGVSRTRYFFHALGFANSCNASAALTRSRP